MVASKGTSRGTGKAHGKGRGFGLFDSVFAPGFSGLTSFQNTLNQLLEGRGKASKHSLETEAPASSPTVTTDEPDYKPGETATLTASGFTPGATITFQIADDPSRPGADGDADVYAPIVVWDGADGVLDGAVTTTWLVLTDDDGSDHGPADALNATLLLSATGSDGVTASTTFTDSAPSVITDKADYAPGEMVTITASGYAAGSTIQFAIADDPTDPGDDGNADVYQPFSITDGGAGDLDAATNGQVVTTWVVPTDNNGTGSGSPDALNATLNLTATGSAGQMATSTFTDANPAPLQTYYVPLPEQQVNYIFNDLENTVSNGIISVISMTMSKAGTLIYYDQWENGYDANIASPGNLYSASNLGGTQIWGNNDPTDGIAPGFSTDAFKAGDFVVLRNVVPTNPRNPAQIFFDGGDKIGATAAIAVTRGYWPQTVEGSGGSVLGGAIEVVDTFRYGTEYKVPVGQNLTTDNDMFSYAALVVGAEQDGTVVRIDADANTSTGTDGYEISVTLNQGQTYVVRGTGDGIGPSLPSGPGINANSRVLASKRVQVDLVTGEINANFESDSFTLTPLNKLGNSYYSPVTTTGPSTASSGPVSYFIYNPGTSAITVNFRTTASSGTVGSIAAGTTFRYTPTVSGSGIQLYTGSDPINPNGATFDVIATYDSATLSNGGQNYDWGWTLTPQNGLTSQVVVGWAQGSSDTSGNVVANANGSPLWVTATANTTVYVDWDGNPTNSTLSAPNGQKYDVAYTVNALQSVRLYDSKFNDSDQSGARLYTTNGALIAVAYGEDQTQQGSVPGFLNNNAFGSTQSSPYLDVGTNVLPLSALAIKKFTNGQDADSPTGPVILVGGTATFTYDVSNNGGVPLNNVTVVDDGGPDASFTPTPVLSGGFNTGDTDSDNLLDPGEIWKYIATKTVTAGQYTNIATVNAKDLSGQDVAPDADPSNHFGAVGAVVIEKQVSVNGGTTWLDADDPTGPVIIAGQAVQYRVAVTNNSTGGLAATVDLSDTTITGSVPVLDFKFGAGNTQTTTVAAGATVYSNVITTPALAGQQTDRAAATATVTDGTNTTPVTVAPDDANYFGISDRGLIAPTGTNCDMYVNGTATTFKDYYASQGGVIQYNVNKGAILSPNPGVFFYYTGLSNTIIGADGSDQGTEPDPILIKIDQSNNGPDIINSGQKPGNVEWNFSSTINDIKLYKVTDLDGDGKIDSNEPCNQVQLTSSQISFGTGVNLGDVTINFTPDAIGSLYVIEVKYDTNAVKGLKPNPLPTVNYTFNTDVGNNGTIDETAVGGITLAQKFSALLLNAPATTGGAALKQDQLAPVVDAAVDYWAAQGATTQALEQLKGTDVLIGDLGGKLLGEADGLVVRLDDDAAGYGWSTSLDQVAAGKVDLLSTLTHEFGHMLGYEHDVMGDVLGVGERHLPFASFSTQPNQMPSLLAI